MTNTMKITGGRRKLLSIVWKRQIAFSGHVMRADGLENLGITGRIAGIRSRGRPRKKYLDRMTETIGGG